MSTDHERGVLDDLASLRREISALSGRVEAAARQGQDTAGGVQRLSGDVATLTRASERLSRIVEGNGSPGLKTELALIRQVVEALSDAAIPETLTQLKSDVTKLLGEQDERREARRRGLWQIAAAWGGQVIAFLFALLLFCVTLRYAAPRELLAPPAPPSATR